MHSHDLDTACLDFVLNEMMSISKKRMKLDVAARATPLLVQYLIDREFVYGDSGFAISDEGQSVIRRMARELILCQWMPDAFGQQAAKLAAKILRSLRLSRIKAEQLVAGLERFKTLRLHNLQARRAAKPFFPPRVLRLSEGWRGRWLNSWSDIASAGAAMGNCLCAAQFTDQYAASVRSGVRMLIALERQPRVPQVLLSLVHVETEGDAWLLHEMEGPDKSRPIAAREPIIELLTGCGLNLSAGGLPAAELAICTALLRGRASGTSFRQTVGGRQLEVGQGFFALIKEEQSVLLQSGDPSDEQHSPIECFGGEHGELARAERTWMRELCGANLDFAIACRACLERVPATLLRAWFGPIPKQSE